MQKNDDQQRYVDLPIDQSISDAPVIYVDGAAGFAIANGMVRFNFFQDRLAVNPHGGDDQIPVSRVVCARMVMSIETAMQLHNWLGDAMKGFQQHPHQPDTKETQE